MEFLTRGYCQEAQGRDGPYAPCFHGNIGGVMTASTAAPSAQDLENKGEKIERYLGSLARATSELPVKRKGKALGHWSSRLDLKIYPVLGLDILTSNLQAKSLEGLFANPRYIYKHPGSLWK